MALHHHCTTTWLQVASGFLLELGNAQQDKFIWDLGTGAYLNLWATGVPMAKLNKVFVWWGAVGGWVGGGGLGERTQHTKLAKHAC